MEATTKSLSLSQRWRRIRRSPRFPIAIFLGLLVLGLTWQAFCFWWDIQIERMLQRNSGVAERIVVYPVWLKNLVGPKFVSRFEPIRSIRLGRCGPKSVYRHDDLRWLRSLYFLQDLDVRFENCELSEADEYHLSSLKGLESARLKFENSWPTIDSIEKLPRLKELQLVSEADINSPLFRKVAAMRQLEQFRVFTNQDNGDHSIIAVGYRELARSPTLRRLSLWAGDCEQLLALINLFPDGSPPFPNLQVLSLTNSHLTCASDLANLKNLKSLIHLDLSHSEISDCELIYVNEIPHLRTLYLEDNRQVTDVGAKILATMTNLQSLNVKGTNISGDGLMMIANLPHLRCLRAHSSLEVRNKLRKRLPPGCELDTR